MGDKVTITELTEFEPTRVDGVGKGANGFPILMLKAVDEASQPDCPLCEGTGKIMEGHRKCPDCGGSGKKSSAGETTKTLAEAAKEAGVAPSGSGQTPAHDCPTCSGYGKIDNGSKDGLQCPDCGGTGRDQATVNAVELNAVPGFGGSISEGDPMNREKIDKGTDPDGFRPAPYKPDPDETVQCPKCERMNDTDSAYCDQCGHELAGDEDVRVGTAKGAGESVADILRHDKGHDDWHASHGDPPCKDEADCQRMQDKYAQEDAAKGMMCSGCKAANKADSNYCAKCGTAMKAAVTAKGMMCSGCKAMNKAGMDNCAKCGMSMKSDATAKADGTFSGLNPSLPAGMPVGADSSNASDPGSPAWEAVDAATATAAATALMTAGELIREFAKRETMEVAAGEGNDIFDANAAEMALVGVSQALGIMAQLAFHEGLEAQKSTLSKAGRRLSGKSVNALAAARDQLNHLLGNDDPAMNTQTDDSDKSAAEKFIDSANKSTVTEGDVLDMTKDELQSIVVETIAEAMVAAKAVEKGKKGKKKFPFMADDTKNDMDSDEDDMDAEKSVDEPTEEMTEAEIAAYAAAKAAKQELKAAKKAAKIATEQAALAKAVEETLAKVAEQNAVLNATVESLHQDLESVKKMAAPSDIVRTRPQEALAKSAERDLIDLEIAKFENLAKSTTDTDLRRGYLDKVKTLRGSLR